VSFSAYPGDEVLFALPPSVTSISFKCLTLWVPSPPVRAFEALADAIAHLPQLDRLWIGDFDFFEHEYVDDDDAEDMGIHMEGWVTARPKLAVGMGRATSVSDFGAFLELWLLAPTWARGMQRLQLVKAHAVLDSESSLVELAALLPNLTGGWPAATWG
jgi:hypothetical protein